MLVVIIIKIVNEIAKRIMNRISESIFLNIVKSFSVCIYILSKRVRSSVVNCVEKLNCEEWGWVKSWSFPERGDI